MQGGDVFASPVTVREIVRKMALGKLERLAPLGFKGTLSVWLREAGYRILPLTRDQCERANALPGHHKDPMDRMLIAEALDRGVTVITADGIFARYGVQTLWRIRPAPMPKTAAFGVMATRPSSPSPPFLFSPGTVDKSVGGSVRRPREARASGHFRSCRKFVQRANLLILKISHYCELSVLTSC